MCAEPPAQCLALRKCPGSARPAVVVVVMVMPLGETAIAEVEIGAVCVLSTYFKCGYFQKPEGFRL